MNQSERDYKGLFSLHKEAKLQSSRPRCELPPRSHLAAAEQSWWGISRQNLTRCLNTS